MPYLNTLVWPDYLVFFFKRVRWQPLYLCSTLSMTSTFLRCYFQPLYFLNILKLIFYLQLPTRMDSNRLHRFSKVLDTNFGNVHLSTRVLPKCPLLEMTSGEVLNITVPTTAFKPQKLLSLPNVDETLGLYSIRSRKGQVTINNPWKEPLNHVSLYVVGTRHKCKYGRRLVGWADR